MVHAGEPCARGPPERSAYTHIELATDNTSAFYDSHSGRASGIYVEGMGNALGASLHTVNCRGSRRCCLVYPLARAGPVSISTSSRQVGKVLHLQLSANISRILGLEKYNAARDYCIRNVAMMSFEYQCI